MRNVESNVLAGSSSSQYSCYNQREEKGITTFNRPSNVMGALGLSVARAALIVILTIVLCWQGLVALFHYLDSPVGSKETMGLPEYTDYFPAFTICPFTKPSIGRSMMPSPELTFTKMIEERSSKVNVYQSFYNVTK